MAVILQFRRDMPRSESIRRALEQQQDESPQKMGEIILFPGVRIERHAEQAYPDCVHHVVPYQAILNYEIPEDAYDSFLYDDYYEYEAVEEEYEETDIFFDSHK